MCIRDRIFSEGMRLLTDPVAYAEMAESFNPYGDGRAAERIVAALEQMLLGGEAPAQFGPGYSRTAIARAAGFEFAELALGRAVDDGTLPPSTLSSSSATAAHRGAA